MRLTRDEIRLVVFILSALVVGAWVRHHRAANRSEVQSPPAQMQLGPVSAKGDIAAGRPSSIHGSKNEADRDME
jgi:hypothetical protein